MKSIIKANLLKRSSFNTIISSNTSQEISLFNRIYFSFTSTFKSSVNAGKIKRHLKAMEDNKSSTIEIPKKKAKERVVNLKGKTVLQKDSGTQPSNLNKMYNLREYGIHRDDIKHNVSFHTETKDNKAMEKMINNMLNEDAFTPEESEEYKTEVRRADHGMRFKNLERILNPHLSEELDLFDTNLAYRAGEKFEFLDRYTFEQKRYLDPLYAELDKLDRPLPYGAKPSDAWRKRNKFVPHKNEWKPNQEHPELFSQQPRFELNYNYNFEDNKIYTEVYHKSKQLDSTKKEEHNKLLSYIKRNPNSPTARNYMRKSVVPMHMLNFPLDSDTNKEYLEWKPEPKKHERRKIVEKNSSDITDYECWRNFNGDVPYLKNYYEHSRRILLVPTKLIKVRIIS